MTDSFFLQVNGHFIIIIIGGMLFLQLPRSLHGATNLLSNRALALDINFTSFDEFVDTLTDALSLRRPPLASTVQPVLHTACVCFALLCLALL